MIDPLVYCLAIRVVRHCDGQIDMNELAASLNRTAGLHGWLMTTQWLFRAPPPMLRPGALTVPVVCPADAGRRVKAADAENERVFSAELIDDVELRQWRWVAFQLCPSPGGRGYFPWECREDGGAGRRLWLSRRRLDSLAAGAVAHA